MTPAVLAHEGFTQSASMTEPPPHGGFTGMEVPRVIRPDARHAGLAAAAPQPSEAQAVAPGVSLLLHGLSWPHLSARAPAVAAGVASREDEGRREACLPC